MSYLLFVYLRLNKKNENKLFFALKQDEGLNDSHFLLIWFVRYKISVNKHFGLVSLFNGMLTTVGYLMPKPSSFFFHHTTCESTCDTLSSSAANQGDNTISVAQGGTATPGATKKLLPPDRVFKRKYIYINHHYKRMVVVLFNIELEGWEGSYLSQRYLPKSELMEFEIAYYDVAVQHVSHYTTPQRLPPLISTTTIDKSKYYR